MATAQASKTTITLKGSSKTVTEFFNIAVNNILYQRGIYPPDSFEQKRYLELPVWLTKDTQLQAYFANVMKQMQEWLATGMLQKLVLVIANAITKEVVERWTFEIETNKEVLSKGADGNVEHDAGRTKGEIQGIVRQICACVTFLPLLSDPCTFDLLVYTDNKSAVPTEWEESDARIVKDAQDLKLRSFHTGVHHMQAMVSFKPADDE